MILKAQICVKSLLRRGGKILIPKVKPGPVFLTSFLMRTLPADRKVELIHILALGTVIVRLRKQEEISAFSEEATLSLLL